jgi:hypothetical protein
MFYLLELEHQRSKSHHHQNQEDLNRSRRNKINFALLGLFLIVGTAVAIHFFYMPLDMLFNKISIKKFAFFMKMRFI